VSLAWQHRASCVVCDWVDPDWFFPGQGQRSHAAKAIDVCTDCPVATDCFEYAVSTDTESGIWGGAQFPLSTPEEAAA
jgi:WhiB family redox-sensing transcriptional regulator